MTLLELVHEKFVGTRAKKSATMRKNLVAEFKLTSDTDLTEELLVNKLLEYQSEQTNARVQEENVKYLDSYKTWQARVNSANKFLQGNSDSHLPQWVKEFYFPELAGFKTPAKYTKTPQEYIRAVSQASYYACDFGRKKRNHFGINTYNRRIGCRSESSGRYSSNCTYTKWDYYADFMCVLSPDKTKLFYRLSCGTEEIKSVTKNGSVFIAGKRISLSQENSTPKIRFKDVRRVVEKVLGKRNSLIKVEFDKNHCKPMLVWDKEEYHFELSKTYKRTGTVESLIQTVIKAIRKRKAEKINLEELKRKASKVFVSIEDSIESGNCRTNTLPFAQSMWSAIGAVGECAVRGDLILERRADNYSLRAVNYAANRPQL